MHSWIYVLESAKRNIRYVGSTDNVVKRLAQHNAGKCNFTKSAKDWKLVYKKEFASRSEAVKQERYLKSGVGRKFLDGILK